MRAISYHAQCKVVAGSNSFHAIDYATGLAKSVRNVFVEGSYAQYMQSKQLIEELIQNHGNLNALLKRRQTN